MVKVIIMFVGQWSMVMATWILIQSYGHLVQYTKIPVLRIRIRLNPLHFGQQDPDPGGKMSAKIMENVHKNQLKSTF